MSAYPSTDGKGLTIQKVLGSGTYETVGAVHIFWCVLNQIRHWWNSEQCICNFRSAAVKDNSSSCCTIPWHGDVAVDVVTMCSKVASKMLGSCSYTRKPIETSKEPSSCTTPPPAVQPPLTQTAMQLYLCRIFAFRRVQIVHFTVAGVRQSCEGDPECTHRAALRCEHTRRTEVTASAAWSRAVHEITFVKLQLLSTINYRHSVINSWLIRNWSYHQQLVNNKNSLLKAYQ